MLADKLPFLFSYIHLQLTIGTISPKYIYALLPKACFILIGSLPTISRTIIFNRLTLPMSQFLQSWILFPQPLFRLWLLSLQLLFRCIFSSIASSHPSHLLVHHIFYSFTYSLTTRFFIFLSRIIAKFFLTFPGANMPPTPTYGLSRATLILDLCCYNFTLKILKFFHYVLGLLLYFYSRLLQIFDKFETDVFQSYISC